MPIVSTFRVSPGFLGLVLLSAATVMITWGECLADEAYGRWMFEFSGWVVGAPKCAGVRL